MRLKLNLVPSDPFLRVHDEDDKDKNDQSTRLQENTEEDNKGYFQTHQVDVEVHHTDEH